MRFVFPAVLSCLMAAPFCRGADADLPITVSRPLRYAPDGIDFVIRNGEHWFNRPLYGPHTAFHIDGGDKPEFALLVTAIKDGVIRLAVTDGDRSIWLSDAKTVTTRYRPGSLIYSIADPILSGGELTLTAISLPDAEGVILKSQATASAKTAQIVFVYGGVGSLRANSASVVAGDVITRSNVNSIRAIDEIDGRDLHGQLELRPEQCRGNQIALADQSFNLRAGAETIVGRVSAGAVRVADASQLASLSNLLKSTGSATPVLLAQLPLSSPVYFAVWRKSRPPAQADLAAEFAAAERHRQDLAQTITVDTPDQFINAVPGALAVAGDACWQPPEWVHGAVSWRTPLLGWRGAYIGDALGWHDRAEAYFRYWASRQNTADDFPTVARANPARNLAENDGKMLHSNGSIPSSHYDMNLIYIDALFRHLLWTGDRKLAADLWPVIQRHLAWEKRCFDRDGLYEGYACIWASDALQYNGGGAAHSTAYNEFHNRMAARLARWLGKDPAPYDAEADRIHAAMQTKLWMPDRGCYAEYLDFMGEKQLHPAAALWSVYHPIDSKVPDPFSAWRCTEYVDANIARIPVRGPGVPAGDFHVLPESNWMPYEWSLNNVVTAENSHMALAYWEAGRPDQGFTLFKSTMLDTMFLGNTPGNIPNLSAYDPYRGETYTDFADPVGITSRALVEGLFGILPDAIAGDLVLRPGFPAAWDHARIAIHDVSYTFRRTGDDDRWHIEQKFPQPLSLRLQLPARTIHIDAITVNGSAGAWKNIDTAIGRPMIELAAAAAPRYDIRIRWSGPTPAAALPASSVPGSTAGAPFRQFHQGDLTWWFAPRPAPAIRLPEIPPPPPPGGTWEPVDLTAFFNDKVTRIFENDYLSPRPKTCSLQMPVHGIGDWTGPTRGYEVDDAGLRHAAGPAGIIYLPDKTPLKTPSDPSAKNIAFTSQFDNYPRRITIPLTGKAKGACFLLAGSTNAMESQLENGQVVIDYAEGPPSRLPLVNPTTWWPIDKNYRIDDYAFRRPGPVPLRLSLASGQSYYPADELSPRGGSATVLAIALDPSRELKSLTLHTESYEIVIGLMSVSLER